MRILEGVGTLIQLGGLMARLCKMVRICTILVIAELTRPTEHKTRAFYHLVLSHCNKEVLLCTSKQRSEMIPLLIVLLYGPLGLSRHINTALSEPLVSVPPTAWHFFVSSLGKIHIPLRSIYCEKKLWRPSTGDMWPCSDWTRTNSPEESIQPSLWFSNALMSFHNRTGRQVFPFSRDFPTCTETFSHCERSEPQPTCPVFFPHRRHMTWQSPSFVPTPFPAAKVTIKCTYVCLHNPKYIKLGFKHISVSKV